MFFLKMSGMPRMPRMPRRLLVLGAIAVAAVAHAQAPQPGYPTKPIHIVVVVAPGGSADGVARIVGDRMSPRLQQPVLIENRPGAGGNIATQAVARAAPDGYTLLLSSNNHTINPSLFANAGYSIDDVVPVAELMRGPSVIAVPANSPYKSLRDLLDDARARPGGVSYGSGGVGIAGHIAAELLQKSAGVKLSHVPYRGSGPSLTDAMGGQIPLVVSSLVAASPHLQSGKLRALAVTSPKRWPSAPSIPAAAETVPGYAHMTWLGLFAPKGTPDAIVQRLNREARAALSESETRSRIELMGGDVVLEDAARFDATLKREYAQSTRLVLDAGMRAD